MSVFLGWMPDAASRAALADLQRRIAGALPADAPRHDWRKPAQWHMTLRYLGNAIDDVQRKHIEAAASSIAAGTASAGATLAGAQYWPQARVLVAKIDPSPELQALLRQLEAAAQACGFARERAQTAHVTLAYLPHRVAPPPPPEPSLPATPLRVDRIHLLRTVPGGYMSLSSWPIAPGTRAT